MTYMSKAAWNRLERWVQLTARGVADISRISRFMEIRQQRNRHNAVLIWIPKTAGTSMANAISASQFLTANQAKRRFAQRGTVTFGHMSYWQLLELGIVKDNFDQSAFKFTFVRHPYDRTLSLYYQLRQHRWINHDWSFEEFLQHLIDYGYADIGLYNARDLSQCNPQYRWIEGVDIDYIGRHENITEDAQYVFDYLGFTDATLLRLNKTIGREDSLLTRSAKEKIEYIYSEDFKQFGYMSR